MFEPDPEEEFQRRLAEWFASPLSHAHPDDAATPEVLLIEDEDELFATPAPRPTNISPELRAKLKATRILTPQALIALPPPDWFIEGLLPHAPRTMLHGQGGSFKSFIMLDWMLCAATGQDWHGHPVRPGKVLYIAGEGVMGLGKRLAAWCQRNGVRPHELDDRLDIMGDPINLGETKHTAIWQGFFDIQRYDYVVIDTLHMASAGAEENSSTDMGRVLENATLMVGPDTALFYVHHTTKTGLTHRGSGALRDDMDVVVACAEVKDVDLTAQLTADKIRDGERFKPVNVILSRYGDGDTASLAVSSIQENVKYEDHTPKVPTAIDKCVAAITEHGIDFERGEHYVSDALKALDLGYNFSRSSTVGPALKRLRGAGQEVRNLMAGNIEIELDEEDR